MNKFNFNKVLKKLEQQKSNLPQALADVTQAYFNKSFENEGWAGTAWQDVKRHQTPKAEYAGMPILQNTGALRNAVNNSLVKADFKSIKFEVVGLKYAAIQNDGGVIHEGGKKRAAIKAVKSIFKKENSKANKTPKAHTITIPQRKYMGHTKELGDMHKQIIKDYIKAAFETES